jgi:hypothetical protein
MTAWTFFLFITPSIEKVYNFMVGTVCESLWISSGSPGQTRQNMID